MVLNIDVLETEFQPYREYTCIIIKIITCYTINSIITYYLELFSKLSISFPVVFFS